jgi:tetratricopeptide (TPR) repeat protein
MLEQAMSITETDKDRFMNIITRVSCGLLLFCFSCTAAGDYRVMSQGADGQQESADPGCAYFYFLWGNSAVNDQRYEEALQAFEKVLVCDPDSEYIMRDIAIVFLHLDKKKEAIEWLQKIIARHPSDTENRILQAKLYAGLNDFDMAISIYNDILKIREDQETLLALGSLYAQLKQYGKAREYMERLVLLNPNSYMGHYSLARLDRESRMFDKAMTEYERALAINWSSRLAYEAAELYEERKKFVEAGNLYRRIVEEDEADETARIRLVSVYLQMGEVEFALKELKEMTVFATEPEKVNFTISRLLISKKRYEEAITVLSNMLKEDPEHHAARYLLALAYYLQGEGRKAQEQLVKIHSDAEVYEDAVLLRARIMQEMKDEEGAVRLLESAIADESSRKMSFYVVLASLYREADKPENGLAVLDTAVKYFPDNAELLFEYGMFLERMGDTDGAMAKMVQVLDKEPENAAALNYVGYTWADKGENLEQALQYIERAVALRPDDGFIRDSLGWVQFRLGNVDRAIEEFTRALELVDDDPLIYEHAGDVYAKAGDLGQARFFYEKALQFFEEEKKKEAVRKKIEQLGVKQ